MSDVPSLGITRIAALHYYVHDLDRSRRFYTQGLDFAEVATSSEEVERRGRQRSAIFQAGDCTIVCSMPIGTGGRAYRYLRRHPDGIGSIVFEVEDAERAFALLDGRGGTPIDEIQRITGDDGEIRTFAITTPFGSTTFRFVERRGNARLFPGFVPSAEPAEPANRFGIASFDHITSNFETMSPALLWLEHVMGFERYWEVYFHTKDVTPDGAEGSGLRSQVMWDPRSGAKFANNEPYRPFFKTSQINVFAEENRGAGIQHAALTVRDLPSAVEGMRARGVGFMPTPAAYYAALPKRLAERGIGGIDEDVALLERLEILVDGKAPGRYLLQIFLKDSAETYGEPDAGPFFFELIQRKGDEGFGEGNFRALFESIEREQRGRGTRPS